MKFLLVDDSQFILSYAKSILEKLNMNLEISLCKTGEEALLYLNENVVDIMLLDIIMPGVSGIDVLKSVMSEVRTRLIEVIMFSSLEDKEILHECFELGASDFIGKPIDELEFTARIKSAIRKKSLEKHSAASLKEIEYQNTVLKDLNYKLTNAQNQIIQQEKMVSVGQLAAGIAHEINNPLGFITSNVSTLRDYMVSYQALGKLCLEIVNDVSTDPVHFDDLSTLIKTQDYEYINQDFEDLYKDTLEGLNRVGKIVKGLRNFSRIDHLDDFDYYNLNEGIENTLIISRNELKYSAEIELKTEPLPDILASGGQINQVLLNILLNSSSAIKEKHKGQMGTICIKTWQEDNFVCVSIWDNGAGIKQYDIKDIFNPFFTTKPVGEGTGLGLSISYDIVTNKHHGDIQVQSAWGQWTEFTLKFPVVEKTDALI